MLIAQRINTTALEVLRCAGVGQTALRRSSMIWEVNLRHSTLLSEWITIKGIVLVIVSGLRGKNKLRISGVSNNGALLVSGITMDK